MRMSNRVLGVVLANNLKEHEMHESEIGKTVQTKAGEIRSRLIHGDQATYDQEKVLAVLQRLGVLHPDWNFTYDAATVSPSARWKAQHRQYGDKVSGASAPYLSEHVGEMQARYEALLAEPKSEPCKLVPLQSSEQAPE